MGSTLLFPLKFFGWVAAGVALAAGWKLGNYLVDVALDEDVRDRFFEWVKFPEEAEETPLWKRQFSKVSGD